MMTRMYRKAVLAAVLGLSFAPQAYAAPQEVTVVAFVDTQAQSPELTVRAVLLSPDATMPEGVEVGSNFFDVSEILFRNGYTVSYPIAPAGGNPSEEVSPAQTGAPAAFRKHNRFQAVVLTSIGEIGVIRFLYHSEADPPHEAVIFGVVSPQDQTFLVQAFVTSTGALVPQGLDDPEIEMPEATQIWVDAGWSLAIPGFSPSPDLDREVVPTANLIFPLPEGDILIVRHLIRLPDRDPPGNLPEAVLFSGVLDRKNEDILTRDVLTRTGVGLPQLTDIFLDDTRLLIENDFRLIAFPGELGFLTLLNFQRYLTDPDTAAHIDWGHVVLTPTGDTGVIRSYFHPGIEAPTEPTD